MTNKSRKSTTLSVNAGMNRLNDLPTPQLPIAQDPIDADHARWIQIRKPHVHVHRSGGREKGFERQRHATHVGSDQNEGIRGSDANLLCCGVLCFV
jgi:hypothetical protein